MRLFQIRYHLPSAPAARSLEGIDPKQYREPVPKAVSWNEMFRLPCRNKKLHTRKKNP
jgi:hypothetical protein